MNMQVAKDTVVTLDYSVTDPDGELVDAAHDGVPASALKLTIGERVGRPEGAHEPATERGEGAALISTIATGMPLSITSSTSPTRMPVSSATASPGSR